MDSAPSDVKIPVVMRKWAIEPNHIEVKLGQHVELDVTSADVEHGLEVPKLGIRESVQPGFVTIVKFHAVEAGEFPMACSVLCGKGHDQMTGKIVVR